jgi:nucleoside-diphosphate kinase
MYDIKNNRSFLKRQEIADVKLEDFFQGARVTVLSRMLEVTDYGDVQTRNHFENQRQRTFALIKPDCYMNMGKIMNNIYGAGFKINRLKMSKFNNSSAE